MVNGMVNLTSSNVGFIENTGICGGAISLMGASTIPTEPNNYELVNNTAEFFKEEIYI